MAIPDYQTVMLPLLQAMKDGRDHALSDIIEELGNQLGLTPEEKRELLPSGTQNTFENRVRWAGTYLFKAGLLDRTGRGVIRIKSRGLDGLKENPTRIDPESCVKTWFSQFEFVDLLERMFPGRLSTIACGQNQTRPVVGATQLGRHQKDTVTQSLKGRVL